MSGYLIAGLVLGSIYAISASGIALTYASTGVLNFGFGAIGFFIARFYYYLNSQHHWSIPYAAVVALAAGPTLGLLLYWGLFRRLRQASSVVKVVVTIGLSVAVPALATTLFGNQTIFQAPGLAPQPVGTINVAGVPITYDQIYVFGALVLIVLVGGTVMRFTRAGLRVRAIVDSEAMTSLSGTNPAGVYVTVWVVSTFFAGLVGILAAPTISLLPNSYTLLTAAAFAAVVAGRLRSIPISVVVALAMGVVSSLIQYAMPPSSTLTNGLVDSVPFAFIAVAIIVFMRRGRLDEREGVGGALDRAIMPQTSPRLAVPAAAAHGAAARRGTSPAARVLQVVKDRPAATQGVVLVVILASLPLILSGQWGSLVGESIAFAIVFLAMTLTTGEGGMVWLCQATFAGIGAVTAAQLATNHGWPVIPAVLVGGVVAAPFGLLVGFFTIRLGDLYVALTTLTFGLLMDNLVFSRPAFTQFGSGVILNRPDFATTDRAFAYLCLVVFCLVALLVVRLRRSTTGLALNAVRASEAGARTIGVSVIQIKLVAAGLGALIAGIGGGFLAMYATVALPASYSTLGGLVWLAVLVTFGLRSNIAAAAAGLAFAFLSAVFQVYLPASIGLLPSILFGLGAVGLAASPDGLLAQYAQALGRAVGKLAGRPGAVSAPDATAASAIPSPESYSLAVLDRPSAAGTDGPVMTVAGVTVRFGGLTALDDVSMEIARGRITGLVGPNGAGKSTLFGMMSGLLRPQAGQVLLDGRDITRLSPQARARCGLARTFQQPELYGGLTVREHLVLAYRASAHPSEVWTDVARRHRRDATERERVDALLCMLALQPVSDQRAGGLPLGVARRLEVARALATGPSVVLLDEPSSGLDNRESARLSALLADVVGELGVSMVLVEHDIAMVLGLSSEIYVLDFGRLIARGDPAAVRDDPAVRRAYLGDEVPASAPAVEELLP